MQEDTLLIHCFSEKKSPHEVKPWCFLVLYNRPQYDQVKELLFAPFFLLFLPLEGKKLKLNTHLSFQVTHSVAFYLTTIFFFTM